MVRARRLPVPRPAHDPDSLPRVGAVLRRLREDAGLTITDAARICGVHHKTWYRREHLGILPPPAELDAFARSVDSSFPLRAKTKLLVAAGVLTDREAEDADGLGALMTTETFLQLEAPCRPDGFGWIPPIGWGEVACRHGASS
jgi:hypothetical protein